ncbi:glycosyltransferase family 4 protein [Calothrix sp. PCC 6303]|uniref:glycosyltransferase family 4 protein n=1 Tax=Calothrix sp. PCC 6303 TaxID=1170562 RepID=UPI0002A03F0D|nr:glycosyltransferase family 4 protein [Calothrix sp. PCC 6303]AFZ02042.1 glycosyl transferase group 1 [Calothrix sp. PCC 6303]
MAKIAVISTTAGYPWGGSEYLWAAMVEQALLEGHEVLVSVNELAVTHSSVIKLQEQGAKIFSNTRSFSLVSRILYKLIQKNPLLKKFLNNSQFKPIFDSNPDVICLSEGHIYSAVFDQDLIKLFQNHSIPYLVVTHLNEECYKLEENIRKTAKKLFSKAKYHVFVSHKNVKIAERQLAQSLPNALVLQNPVNLVNLNIVSWLQQSTIFFASVARLDAAYKGQDILFEILSSPVWQQRNWQLNLYGSGPDQSYLEALAEYYGIAHRVKFFGHVNDIRSIWSNNHILLLPSREEGGPPISLVETMLCGRPVVATDVGAVTEWIEDELTGFIAEAPTLNLFAAAMNRAWQSQNNWEKMGVKAHEIATAKLDHSPGCSLLKLVLDASTKHL